MEKYAPIGFFPQYTQSKPIFPYDLMHFDTLLCIRKNIFQESAIHLRTVYIQHDTH